MEMRMDATAAKTSSHKLLCDYKLGYARTF